MHAYDELYLEDAQERLGSMMDFAVGVLGLGLTEFYGTFLASDLAIRFSQGEPSLVSGRSGAELALMVADQGKDRDFSRILKLGPKERQTALFGGKNYWAGWALAYYQWHIGLTFTEINRFISINNFASLYNPYHEMDIRQLCDVLDARLAQNSTSTNLKRLRESAGYSQSQLAKASGVSVRSIQHYEQRQKDINRAQFNQVMAIAQALCCSPTDLMEPLSAERYDYAVVQI